MDTSPQRTRTFTWQDPLIGAQIAPTLSGLDYLLSIQRGELPPPPVANLLDMQLDHVESGKATFALTPAEFHYNPIGAMHGGIIATLCDSAMGCAVHTRLPAGVGYTSLEIKVSYIRAITLATGPIRCEGTVLTLGRRVATAEARILDAKDRLLAHATTTCLIMRETE